MANSTCKLDLVGGITQAPEPEEWIGLITLFVLLPLYAYGATITRRNFEADEVCRTRSDSYIPYVFRLIAPHDNATQLQFAAQELGKNACGKSNPVAVYTPIA